MASSRPVADARRARRTPAPWLPVAVVVGLFAVAAIGVQTSAGAPSQRTRTSLLSIGQWLIGFAVIGGVVMLVIGMLAIRGAPRGPRRSTSTAALIAYLVIGFGVLFLLASGRHGVLRHAPRPASGPSGGASNGPATGRASTYLPPFPWVGFFVTVTFLVVAFVAMRMMQERRRPRAALRGRQIEGDIEAQSDDATLLELARHGEPRAAVRASYELARRTLARDGVAPQDWEAPREYATRVMVERAQHGPALQELTTLYEKARFSGAAVDETARSAALAIVEQLDVACSEHAAMTDVLSP
jgi:hypothetical protein